MNDSNHVRHAQPLKVSRRQLLVGGGLAASGLALAASLKHLVPRHTPVFIARNQRYDEKLQQSVRDGLLACRLNPQAVRGKRVLLKPNIVEPAREAAHVTTHPALVVATAEVFRRWGALVTVGEGPGHVRDTEMALLESGMAEALADARLPFADLNYEETSWISNRGAASNLKGFHMPRSVTEADLIVSMPKMKTHHWVGVTASMKNLYGVIPGIRYGWPKNVLHYHGIPQTVHDINASLPKTIAVVDGIDCMEGDGPIMGSPKAMGVILVGDVPAAVDATVCRLMDVPPERIDYLRIATNRLGPIHNSLIEQRGEDWESLVSAFEILDKPHLRHLREHRTAKPT